MKTLLLLRHGKADPNRSGDDHARRLTERGRRDSLRMGGRAIELVDQIDLVVTSDAARAQETAELAVQGIGVAITTRLDHAIYLAAVNGLLALVQRLPDDVSVVMLVGHNPGFQDLANTLTGDADGITHLPTAGLVTLKIPVELWRLVKPATAKLIDLSVPRAL